MSSVLSVSGLSKSFQTGGMFHTGLPKRAVIDLSFELDAGETLAIVGESGSGKSTAARMAMRLLGADSGRVFWGDEEVTHLSDRELRRHRRHIQMVFQDPFASLNPRMNVWESVAEGLRVHHPELNRKQRRERVANTLAQCGLDESSMDRYPHQFSGGQRQRIGIARALVVQPKVLVLDEAVSALDVSVQAQILNLLKDLQRDRGLAYLFISHDLSVVRHIADRVAVMFAGHVVEWGKATTLFDSCHHPYTEALLQSRPVAHPDERNSSKEAVAAIGEGVAVSGCPFRKRCLYAQKACSTFEGRAGDGEVACLFPLK